MIEAKKEWKFAYLAWALPIIGLGIGGFLYIIFRLIVGPWAVLDLFFGISIITCFIIAFIISILCFVYQNKYEKTMRHGLGGLIVFTLIFLGQCMLYTF